MNNLMTRHTDFVVRNVFDMGPDYARTLAHWRQRFVYAWQDIEKLGFDDRFRRMWLYYFVTARPDLTHVPSAWYSLRRNVYEALCTGFSDGGCVRSLLDAGGAVS
jgi:hypothetical protein